MDVKQSALPSCMNGRFRFIDNGWNAMQAKNAGKCQASKASTNTCDRVRNFALLLSESACGLTVATSTEQLPLEALAESHRR